jgi:uncharacterized protein (DUF1697 family)
VRSFVALLRGVNVGGARRVGMEQLRSSLTGLGLRSVRTYLQSGNAVFTAPADSRTEQLAATIADAILADFGLEVPVLVLTRDDLEDVALANPFAAEPDADIRPLHATFVANDIDADAFSALKLPAGPGEEVALGERVVYLRLPDGYGRTKLHNGYFERALGQTATTRNWRSVLALAEMAAESDRPDAASAGAS